VLPSPKLVAIVVPKNSCADSIGEAAALPKGVQRQKNQRRQHSIEVQQTEHAPIECGLGIDAAFEGADQIVVLGAALRQP
jgi:hypothetical protein